MRILFTTDHSYIPERAGGVESSTHACCVALKARGHEVAVLCSLDPAGSMRFKTFLRRKLGGRASAVAERSLGYPAYRTWGIAETLGSVCAEFKPSVVCVQPGCQIPLAHLVAARCLPAIVYLHDTDFPTLGDPPRPGDQWFYAAVSSYVAREAAREFGIVATVIPPLVDKEHYRVASSRSRVLFVNPDPLKGVEIALAIAEARPDIPFDFVECWPSNRKQKALRQRALRAGNVVWHAPTQDMRAHYRNTRLVLVPSVCPEGWGRVVTEAQVSGIPALASNRGGLPESVGPGGILVAPETGIRGWLDALARLWDDQGCYERLSQAAFVHSQRDQIQTELVLDSLVSLAMSTIALGRKAC